MEQEKFDFTDLLSNHETLDGFNPTWEPEGYEIVSEILHQIVSEVCKNTPPKSKKRSIDKTEIDKKKGDKKHQKKDTTKPSGEQLLAEQTPAMKTSAMQALGQKPQNFRPLHEVCTPSEFLGAYNEAEWVAMVEKLCWISGPLICNYLWTTETIYCR